MALPPTDLPRLLRSQRTADGTELVRSVPRGRPPRLPSSQPFERIVLGEQLLHPRLIDPADDLPSLLPVPDHLRQSKSGGHQIEDGNGQEAAYPGVGVQPENADSGGRVDVALLPELLETPHTE